MRLPPPSTVHACSAAWGCNPAAFPGALRLAGTSDQSDHSISRLAHRSAAWLAVLTALVFAWPQQASAQNLPPASAGVHVDVADAQQTMSGIPSSLGPIYNNDGSGGFASAQIALTGNDATLTSTAYTPTGYINESDTAIEFHFEIVGPSAASVPVVVVANGVSSISGNGTANASIRIQDESDSTYALNMADTKSYLGGSNDVGSDFNLNEALNLAPNTDYYVVYGTFTSTFGTATATATLDPYFFLDPNFANAGEYSIDMSPGAPIPEPSTYAAILGAAALGFAAIRRKRMTLV